MQNDQRASLRDCAGQLEQAFIDAGALRIEADALVSADTLLDLYGEDIRARAYVTQDPVAGEMMMRPDFTVPIVERHMAEGAEPARYTYNGPVWRKQAAGSARPTESLQVGFELFDSADPAAADAEVFALFANVLPKGMVSTTGDVGLLSAAIRGLKTTDRRKAALLRHLWRPKRFDQLMRNYAGENADEQAGRIALLASLEGQDAKSVIEAAGRPIGLRNTSQILARIEVLQNDAKEPPLSEAERGLIQALFGMACTYDQALVLLETLRAEHPFLDTAVAVFRERAEALTQHGVDVGALQFVGSYGLTNMEYYDGFVFGFSEDATVVATGGRYDALTSVLGQGRAIAAVGGVVRPDALLATGWRGSKGAGG